MTGDFSGFADERGQSPVFKRIRVVILLYLLAFVAVGNWLASARTTDWDEPLWVDVHPVNADGSVAAQAYIDSLTSSDLDPIEEFFAREAARYGVAIEQPFRLELGPQLANDIPQLPESSSVYDAVIWSLRMRWFALGVDPGDARPTPDIKLFALYHDGSETAVLDRSTALERGLIAVARLFAGRASRGPNHIVMAHELVHTLGATDKYDLATNLPIFPHGYAQPDRSPRYPQQYAELMAGRVPLDAARAEMPAGLRHAVVGSATALEIGWLAAR